MKCKKCGGELEIDFTKILTSLPAKYEAKCKDCGDITYLLCSECHNTEGSCLQSIYGAGKINDVRLNELDSLEVNGTKETGSINDVLWNGESITKIKSNYPYNYQKPIKKTTKLLIVEDGSIDLENCEQDLLDMGIKCIVYRQGSQPPRLYDLGE